MAVVIDTQAPALIEAEVKAPQIVTAGFPIDDLEGRIALEGRRLRGTLGLFNAAEKRLALQVLARVGIDRQALQRARDEPRPDRRGGSRPAADERCRSTVRRP